MTRIDRGHPTVYVLNVTFPQYDPDRDARFEKAMRSDITGAGTCLLTGMRDVDFEFDSKAERDRAEARAEKLKAKFKIKSIRTFTHRD